MYIWSINLSDFPWGNCSHVVNILFERSNFLQSQFVISKRRSYGSEQRSLNSPEKKSSKVFYLYEENITLS